MVFFFLSTVPDPLRCLNMSKRTKTISLTQAICLPRLKTRLASSFVKTWRKTRALAFHFNTNIVCFGVYCHRGNLDGISLFYLPNSTHYDAKICQEISKQSAVPRLRCNGFEPAALVFSDSTSGESFCTKLRF